LAGKGERMFVNSRFDLFLLLPLLCAPEQFSPFSTKAVKFRICSLISRSSSE
jgi:hypothetical protein